jgi:hypothetical protein
MWWSAEEMRSLSASISVLKRRQFLLRNSASFLGRRAETTAHAKKCGRRATIQNWMSRTEKQMNGAPAPFIMTFKGAAQK